MIGGESPTPMDLRFSLARTPVRVSVWFWIIMAVLGYGVAAFSPGNVWVNLLIWVACGFVSILVHEMGHVLAYRVFGSVAGVTLHGFGGYAQASFPPPQAWQRMLVSLAGPVAGFALAGLVWAAVLALGANNLTPPEYAANALLFLLLMNVFWNVFNLIPIRPLDGGNVLREVLAIARVPNPDAVAHGVGFALSALLALWGALNYFHAVPAAVYEALPGWFVRWVQPGPYMTLWFVMLAVANYQQMQQFSQRGRYYDEPDDDSPPWRR